MTAAITTTARATVVTALDTALSCTVYATAPAVPIPPCVTIVPDDPYLVPLSIGGRLRAEMYLRALVVTRDNNDLATHESLLEHVLLGMPEAAIVASVTAPASTDIGPQGSVLVSEIRFHLNIKE